MRSPTQCLLAATALVLFSIGLWQMLSRVDPATISSPEPATKVTSTSHRGITSAQASNGTVTLEKPVTKQDKFAGREVIAEKETVQEVAGVQQVKRVRLLRDPSFKYPLIRVEDELVRGPEGDRLIRQVAMVGDHVLVKPANAQMSETALLEKLKAEGATLRRKMPASGTWLIAFSKPDLETVPRMVAEISAIKKVVRYAEPDFIMSTNAVPNDTSFGELWAMHNTGQNSGIADADVDAPEAWALTTGNRAVKVAIIDSGIDLTHPDLAPNLWTNPREEAAANGLDDDNNGFIDDVRGWDFVNNDAIPQDDHGHGTHCAGTIGAVGNNNTGVAGICWNVSLIALKTLNASGNGTLSDGIEAIAYSTSLGVTLTSNSWTGGEYSQAMADVIEEANEAGILFIAAAGNNSSYTEYYPEYPASYPGTNIISVAATTRQDGLAAFSNYGPISTDLGAPGQDIYSAAHGGGYVYNSGTSMACPHVAGACALLKAFRPTLTHDSIRNLILRSVDQIPSLTGKTVTGGRLNLYNALLASDDILVTPGSGLVALGPLGGPFAPPNKVYTLTNDTETTATWTATVDKTWITLTPPSGQLSAGESMTFTASINAQANELPAGTHVATLTVLNSSTGRTQIRSLAVQVNSVPVYQFDLETDPGWPRTGEWAYGVPQGGGGLAYGRPDPKSGATGSKVLGINLTGDYSTDIAPPQYLTAGPFNLTDHLSTRLRFQRWLNSDYQTWVYATVQVSSDGSTWNTLWENGSTPYSDAAWTEMEYDLSAYADGKPQVYIRWGHQVANFGTYPYSGWNLDDIQILGAPKHQLTLTLPASLIEGSSAGPARIRVNPAPPAPLMVNLASSRPGAELSLPFFVTVPAGALEVNFEVSAIQDILVDGSQPVTITATAQDYPTSVATMLVHDDEQGALTLNLPASFAEGSGEVLNSASLQLAQPAAADIVISLQSSDTTELQVPASVTLPEGQQSVPIPLTFPEDVVIDGSQTVTLTAAVTNWPNAQRNLTVTDNESRQLTLTLPAKRREGAGTLNEGGSVSVAGLLATALTVNLTSSDTTELTVPATVTLPAGSASARFALQLQDDALTDGDQIVTVTASSATFITATTSLSVTDDEVPALPVLPTPTDGQDPTHPKTSLTWQYDADSGAIPESYQIYFGTRPDPTELLGSTSATSWQFPLPGLRSATQYYWRIVARRGSATRSGAIWSFKTPPVGPLHHFVWDPTPAAVALGVPFPVRVTAVDEYDIPLARYESQTPFTAQLKQPESTTGTGTYPWTFPLATNYHDARSQMIYTPAEAGPAGQLTALAIEVNAPPGQPLTQFTLRLKHTTKTDYLSAGLTWENEEWTTVYATEQTFSTPGWTWFVFTTPFDYDGTRNLMVDISFNNAGFTTDGTTRTTITNDYRTLAFRTDSGYGDPLTWAGNYPTPLAYNGLPNLRLRRADQEVPLSPETSGPFNGATWSGQITLLDSGSGLRLKARDAANAALFGLSDPLDVVMVGDFVLASEPLFTGGLSNTLSGESLGDGYEYEFQRATQADFSDAASSGYVTSPQHLFAQLTDGRLYHFRGRARTGGALGKWSPVERSTQDATPPTIAFTQPSGGLTSLGRVDLGGAGADSVSGISNVMVNDIVGISQDSFANWNAPSLSLAEGLNTFTLTATDKAVPPNVRNVTWTITRITDPEADANGDGITSLMDYAFHTAGNLPSKALPIISAAKHPDTGQTHLILSYRRLISNPSQILYLVETSDGLQAWQPLSAPVEYLSITPTGDGVTESVKVRLHPSIEVQKRRFARVRVETPASE